MQEAFSEISFYFPIQTWILPLNPCIIVHRINLIDLYPSFTLSSCAKDTDEGKMEISTSSLRQSAPMCVQEFRIGRPCYFAIRECHQRPSLSNLLPLSITRGRCWLPLQTIRSLHAADRQTISSWHLSMRYTDIDQMN